MQILYLISAAIGIMFLVCYAYQLAYIPAVWIGRRNARKSAETVKNTGEAAAGGAAGSRQALPVRVRDAAALICARNEETVIRDLIRSLKAQTYPRAHLKIFVMADNCTDRTADIARTAGAAVYERQNTEQVGKGWALQALLGHIREDFPNGFDTYYVFDADNLLEPDYIEQMDRMFAEGYEIVTSYRNSKNYGTNWISAGYALWFLRESRYLNHARHLLGTSCAVSGTGFAFSRAVAEEAGDWPYHLLTEDIEFSIDQITKGRRIAFCEHAVLYDEQPVTFAQSVRQRMRWVRGYLQVFRHYGRRLFAGIFRGNFACYDMTMNIFPAFFLSAASIAVNVLLTVFTVRSGAGLQPVAENAALSFLQMYGMLFLIGAVTTATEWRQIRTAPARKIGYLFTFPLFMFTYLPVAVAAVFKDTGWKPITHSVTAEGAESMAWSSRGQCGKPDKYSGGLVRQSGRL